MHSLFVSIRQLVVISFLLLTTTVTAHEGDHSHVSVVQPAEIYRPTAMPDRIVLCWNNDPRTTQAVNWRTSQVVKKGFAEIAPAEAGPNFPEHAKQVVATTESLTTDINQAHFHSVSFTDLTPGRRYAYRVGDGANWSEWFHFSTASATPEPFSFIYFGDAQNNIRSMWSRVLREAQRDAPKAAFFLHAGDLVNRAEMDGEWGEWFGAGDWLNAMIPSIAVPGNHEQAKKDDGTRRLSNHWKPSFTFPENGPTGLEETCYTLVYQNMRIIALNSNERQAEQTEWLRKVLKENQAEWVVCTFHHPIYSTGKDRDNPELRALWKPLFDEYKVDLVLQGHDHTYGRTGLDVPETIANVPTGIQAVEQKHGTVYVVSVSGPKMYNNNRLPFMKRLGEDTQLYQIIHIDGPSLRFEARTAIGELYDAFELRKQENGPNQLIERTPEVSENLRPITQ
ncbi:Alkaline phosphatase precursor [Roseimaritima multifibrata]|uniref:Alkaline phosphatase n=1 Tax=Roseimaritima multifibrata TaxID=1930274 RepID=A0A517MKR7_9BACT|nr:metallophosphoesterase family protein [Roseimaritima multifibrata]QDS95479.1 Alkaline phosphatase precursor [Roseimaritima multifibrata]